MRPERARWLGLVGWLAITFVAAAIGSMFEPGAWYRALTKPDWTPPAIVFGPVWTVLYTLMAVAAWLVWEAAGFTGARVALGFYLVQLAVNAAWSWLFFGENLIGVALIDLVALVVLVVVTLVLFWRVRRAAGLLLVPYLLWITYAAALNLALFRLNP